MLDLDTFVGAGQANLQSIGEALTRFKAAKKPIYAYATAYTDDGYYLAAHANKIWLNPIGAVLVSGPGATNLYFKRLLDKLDVDVNVFKVGTYKAAVEPFTRSESSPEAKAAEQALVDTLWQSYVSDVKAARPKAELTAYIAQLPQRLGAAARRPVQGGARRRTGRHHRHPQRFRRRHGQGGRRRRSRAASAPTRASGSTAISPPSRA